MKEKQNKEPFKIICGVCAGYIGESDNPEGELGYDGCEHNREIWEYLHK